MQIIWVSGPVGKIKTFNLTLKNLIILLASVAFALVLLGALFQLIGFRMAIELNPSFLRKMGNLHSATEIENLKHFYGSKLQEIQKQVEINNRLVIDLQDQNKKLVNLATPQVMQKEKSILTSSGGPFIPPGIKDETSVLGALGESLAYLKNINQQLALISVITDKQIDWIVGKPLSMPVPESLNLSSGYGRRIDPFTNTWSEHIGLDFPGSSGNTIYAAGSGVVKFAGWDNAYGQSVIIDHGDGYTSRYAHASQILITQGSKVNLKQPIALIGTTGRSTGPHLHFEIMKNGVAVNPADFLIGLNH